MRRVDSRALRAAIRAAAAWIAFWMMSRPSRGCASSQWPNASVMARCTKPLTSELPSLVLVWPSNWGSPSLTEMTAIETLTDVVAGEVLVLLLEDVLLAREVVDQLGHRRAEALLVGAALVGVHGVGVGVDRLGVAVGPLHRQLERERPVLVLDLDRDDVGVDRLGPLGRDEVLDVVDQAVVVTVGDPLRLLAGRRRRALVDRHGLDVDLRVGVVEVDVVRVVGAGFGPLVEQGDGQALVEERRLLEPGPDRLEVEDRGLEDRGAGPEGDRRAGLVRVVERLVLRQRAAGDAVVEGHPEHVAHLADLDVEPAREGVDHGDADTVQPAGHLVAAAAELPAGVQLREHQLHGGDVLAVRLPVGMPRPLSTTVTPPSARSVTSMWSA